MLPSPLTSPLSFYTNSRMTLQTSLHRRAWARRRSRGSVGVTGTSGCTFLRQGRSEVRTARRAGGRARQRRVRSPPWTRRGEGGVVPCGEGIGGVGEEGDDRGGAVVEGGVLQGSVAAVIGCAQRQRVLADQELENGLVAVPASSAVKSREPSVAGDGQLAPLPRVELGLRDHQLNEFQWRRVDSGDRDGSPSGELVLEEDLIGRVTVSERLDMGDGHRPIPVIHELVQRVHRPAGAARVSVRSGGVCLSLT